MRVKSRSLDYGLNDDHYEIVQTEDTDTDEETGSIHGAVMDAPPTHTALHRPEERESSEEEGRGHMIVTGSSASLMMTATAVLPSTVAEDEEVDESKVTGDSGIEVPILPSAPCYGQ